jgi:AcrR family transcriptional regulator
MAERIRVVLEEGARLGFPATRGIGQMEWARDGVLGIDELVAYEHQLNSIVSRPHVLICAYDMRRHSASRIAAMVAGHQAIFSGGRLRRPDGFGLGSAPRDRILSAASRLFADAGVRAVGVDTLIREAGVAKATFYRQFPSKDDLIVAWLEDPRTRWFDRVRAEAESRASSPRDVVAHLFNVVAEWLEAADYRGCPYLNTAVEIPDPAHRAVPVIQAYLEEIERYLQGAVGAAGYSDSERIGSALQTLLAGSISLGVAHRTNRFALQAREAAMGLLDGTPGNADPAPVATKDRPGQPSARMPTSGSSEP